MGGEPWFYVVPYQVDIEKAMLELRQREFEAGRYNPVISFPPFPVTATSPAPGRQHTSIAEALDDTEADGSRSILDMQSVSDKPGSGVVARMDDRSLIELFGTTRPTRVMVEMNQDFFEQIDRGQGIYIVLYHNGKPDEILFAGYSYD